MRSSEETTIKEWTESIESKLGLPIGFFFQLREEKDWAFVIQSHALLETLMTELLVETLGRDELRPFVVHLNAASKRTGKLGLLLALGLVERKALNIIEVLAGIRNSFAHNVSRIGTTLPEYVAGLPKQDLGKLVRIVSDHFDVTKGKEEKEFRGAIEVLLRKVPKQMLWACIATTATVLSVHHDVAKLDRWRQAQTPRFGNAILEALSKAEPEAKD